MKNLFALAVILWAFAISLAGLSRLAFSDPGHGPLAPVPRDVVNTTRLVGNSEGLSDNQNEVVITIDPQDPENLFVLSNHEPIGTGLFAAYSDDGGISWNPSNGADAILADGGDSLPIGRGDPGTAFDAFGNLFITYLSSTATSRVSVVARSFDGGQSFDALGSFGVGTDRPVIGTGPSGTSADGSVWLLYIDATPPPNRLLLTGAPVTLNPPDPPTVGAFSTPAVIATDGLLAPGGDLAVGPEGQVLVVYRVMTDGSFQTSTIFASIDADGLGPGAPVALPLARPNNMGFPTFSKSPAASERGVATEENLAWDRSVDPALDPDGRVYLVFTDQPTSAEDADTNIFVLRSSDSGTTWQGPVQVHPDNSHSQFLPAIAVDQTSGHLAVSWQDARRDELGSDSTPNSEVELYAAVSLDGGESFLPNVRVSRGFSNEDGAEPHSGMTDSDFAEYTGLAFHAGSLYPAWADNSNSTLDNADAGPNPPLATKLDIYTARVDLEADSDGDGAADEIDGCVTLSSAEQCDTDLDGYGNACDGDFDQSFTVAAPDFSNRFLPDFKAGTDLPPIDGTDMNCVNGVNAVDFEEHFLPQFNVVGKPGPSGLSCAGKSNCEAPF